MAKTTDIHFRATPELKAAAEKKIAELNQGRVGKDITISDVLKLLLDKFSRGEIEL